MPAPPPVPPPWRLTTPPGPVGAADGIVHSINSEGEYELYVQSGAWRVERKREPPALWRELDWKIRRLADEGSQQNLLDHLASWPPLPGGSYADADAMVTELERRTKPANDDPIRFAEAARYAGDALMTVPANSLAAIAERIARKLLDWFPSGQMLIWGKNYEYAKAGRPAHLLAAGGLIGLGGVDESLKTERGTVWTRGEEIVHTHVGSLYVNLVNSEEMPGWAFETLAATFVFEFATNVMVHPSLDFMSIRYLNSLPVLDYLPANLPEQSPIIQVGFVDQDVLRAWFLAGVNRLAEHLIRWENFTTAKGDLRLVSLQETNMTMARILNTTSQLLASEERGSRLMALWDLVDLYAGLMSQDIPRLFEERYWRQQIVPGLASMPAHHAALFARFAGDLYSEWVEQCIQGITTPSRVLTDTVRVGNPERPIPRARYFARHMKARRNTLHGYDLRSPENLELLAIHDGSLPQRLPEWGRIMLLSLLGDPTTLLGRFRRLSRGAATTKPAHELRSESERQNVTTLARDDSR